MNLFRLGTALAVVGVLLVGGSVAWWQKFYAEVAAFLGTHADPPLQCLYSVDGPCGQVIELAAMVGANPYRPGLFWIGAVALVIGGVLEFAAKPSRRVADGRRPEGERLFVPGPDGVSSEEWERFKAAAFPKDKP
ncbi:hypothetical protein [Methylobacterium sp. 391_Methyba4]|uniref:hypothetical protein n=1 Tax=Methylobacterium sp. 391_Methyba4 TaxID=3038924 RepID=UPI00241E5C13|nr:hypothetical protein [Methylobacterium sp. 391_Methyba4]WFS07610.1 hypothetical protein P9K36_30395 [Methylobacterium sp. 391_Methyba4]